MQKHLIKHFQVSSLYHRVMKSFIKSIISNELLLRCFLFLLHVISELHVLLSLPFFSSFSSAPVQLPSNSLRFYTGAGAGDVEDIGNGVEENKRS
jgi:hypothetical protein